MLAISSLFHISLLDLGPEKNQKTFSKKFKNFLISRSAITKIFNTVSLLVSYTIILSTRIFLIIEKIITKEKNNYNYKLEKKKN